jgi:ribonuclease G
LIEPTEAMTVIDVNSSKNVKKNLPQEQHLQINLEAAAEIARQLRLRNLSGIIIIDFIDLKNPEDQEALLTAMRRFVKSDPVKTEVIDLTKLGLMELTRKKIRKPLHEQIPFDYKF